MKKFNETLANIIGLPDYMLPQKIQNIENIRETIGEGLFTRCNRCKRKNAVNIKFDQISINTNTGLGEPEYKIKPCKYCGFLDFSIFEVKDK